MMRKGCQCRWWQYVWFAAAVQRAIATADDANDTASNETAEDTTPALTPVTDQPTTPGTTPDISWLQAEDCSVGFVTAGYDIYPNGVECHPSDRLSLTECSTAVAHLSTTCPHLPLAIGAVKTDAQANPAQGCYMRLRGSSLGDPTGMNFAWGVPSPYWQYYDGDVGKEFHAVCHFSNNYFSRDYTTESLDFTTPELATRAPATGVVSGGQRGVQGMADMVMLMATYIMLSTCLKVAGW
mmetsp:Transcript_9829/g.17814  ORF Transcript_9829/g.17814 Transcript_9829/m.17814 type:complete len:239 (-) Transcript_9829:154-870(-)